MKIFIGNKIPEGYHEGKRKKQKLADGRTLYFLMEDYKDD